jgi:glyceraldehyde-3-phosphate dehydrogenase (NADP+)
VAAVAPFNFPLNLVAHKVAPALAAGCPIVLKPASQTPLTALKLAEIVDVTGLPDGAFSVLPCARGPADALVTDPRVKLLSFTGSPGVGWDMKARAGKKRVILELGGNAFVVVNNDADLDLATARILAGAFAYAGQVCISVQHVLAHASVHAALTSRLLAALSTSVPVGDPLDPSVVCGPLIDDANATRMTTWIAEATQAGGRVLTGGKRTGNVVTPTLLADVPPSCRIAAEEAFGPIACLASFDSLDDAIARINASTFGLQAGVFTNRVDDLWRLYEALDVGGVIHNDAPTFRVDHMPYGGIKDSGFGREGLPTSLADYTEPKLLALRPHPR